MDDVAAYTCHCPAGIEGLHCQTGRSYLKWCHHWYSFIGYLTCAPDTRCSGMAVNPGETWTATSTDVACTLEKVLPSTLCTLSCAAGFLLSQMLDATTCQYDGSVAAWTGTVPPCLGEE